MLLKETHDKLLPTLKTYFGYDSFRDQQEKIVESVLSKNDNLVIMPTGGGKSICFQLPALLFDGITLVISPLIALMKDQVDGLKANGIEADFYNSSQEKFEQDAIFDKIYSKELKLLYVAPESLSFLENILNEEFISCVAIDEAHCISSWGHDFRPSYQQLGFLKNNLPNTPIIALTATADKATRADITEQLNIPMAIQFVASFDRENIELEVRPANDRISQIIRFIEKQPEESWTKGQEGKWTTGQHALHLLHSIKPLDNALSMPKFVLRLKFGKANRPVRDYEAIAKRYQERLEDVKGKGNTRNGSWVLDHCHETESFRGWLCHKWGILSVEICFALSLREPIQISQTVLSR